jgi:hypothetical protein
LSNRQSTLWKLRQRLGKLEALRLETIQSSIVIAEIFKDSSDIFRGRKNPSE